MPEVLRRQVLAILIQVRARERCDFAATMRRCALASDPPDARNMLGLRCDPLFYDLVRCALGGELNDPVSEPMPFRRREAVSIGE